MLDPETRNGVGRRRGPATRVDDEQRLVEKLRRVQALFARPGTDGERSAAAGAAERLRTRLREVAQVDPLVEYQFSMPDAWWTRRATRAMTVVRRWLW